MGIFRLIFVAYLLLAVVVGCGSDDDGLAGVCEACARGDADRLRCLDNCDRICADENIPAGECHDVCGFQCSVCGEGLSCKVFTNGSVLCDTAEGMVCEFDATALPDQPD